MTTTTRTRTNRRHRTRPLRHRLIAATSGLALALGLGMYTVSTGQATPAPTQAATENPTENPTEKPTREETGPPQKTFASATTYALTHPAAVPSGANDWSCTPTSAHPNPVVLVHGTFENRYTNWAGLAPKLNEAGYCVYALNYGGTQGDLIQATGDIPTSAAQLDTFIEKVRAHTGATEVDLVGHSQGGMMPRYYIKNLDGADKIGKLIALAPNNHGTSLSGLATMAKAIPGAEDLIGKACPSCEQQMTDSQFITALNEGGETDPEVDYTVLATTTDWVITPYTSSYLAKADNVTQTKLQDHCALDLTEHLGISYNQPSMQLVLNALDPTHAQEIRC